MMQFVSGVAGSCMDDLVSEHRSELCLTVQCYK